jgi:hypothetical protein
MRKKILKSLIIVPVLIFILYGIFATETLGNVWGLLSGRGYFIPNESSVFTFQVTKMNEGSGEWWLYGEDAHFYYAVPDQGKLKYMKISRKESVACKNFDKWSYSSWCN